MKTIFIINPKAGTGKNLDKRKEEYFDEYGYNLSSSRKKQIDHFKQFSYTNQNNIKRKPKR